MEDRDLARFTARRWWLYRSMSEGEHGDRVELERGDSSTAREARRAYDLVEQTMGSGGDEAIRLLLALLDTAPQDEGTVAVGTGPLEDLINDHGDDLVDAVEQAARQSPEFAQALGHVALEPGALRPETLSRLARWLPAR